MKSSSSTSNNQVKSSVASASNDSKLENAQIYKNKYYSVNKYSEEDSNKCEKFKQIINNNPVNLGC